MQGKILVSRNSLAEYVEGFYLRKRIFPSHEKKFLAVKMDLNNFMSDVEKKLYKVTYILSGDKIKRFVRACSKENAKYLVEQDLKNENRNEKFKIIDVEDITEKQKVIENGISA